MSTRPINDTAWLAGTRDGHQVRFDHVDAFGPAAASVALTWIAQGSRCAHSPSAST